jgi:hypothetical protein
MLETRVESPRDSIGEEGGAAISMLASTLVLLWKEAMLATKSGFQTMARKDCMGWGYVAMSGGLAGSCDS